MLHSRRKAEIEILSTVHTERLRPTHDTLQDELDQEMPDALTSGGEHPPLLDYLITKISVYVANHSSKCSQHS